MYVTKHEMCEINEINVLIAGFSLGRLHMGGGGASAGGQSIIEGDS